MVGAAISSYCTTQPTDIAAHPSQLLLLSEGNLLFSLTLFSVFIHNKALFGSFGFDPQLAVSSPYGGPQPIAIGFMLYQLLSEPLDTFVKFGVNALTRKFEYQADEFAVNLGYKNELASGLIKLHIDNLSSPHADKLFSMYNHSHPTLPERLRAMDEYKGGDGLKKKNGTVEVKKDL
jgi:STE24 endopeptidase